MLFDASALTAFITVVLIDVSLVADNVALVAVVVAHAPPRHRKKIMFYGIALAAMLRIGLALIATRLLGILGLTFAGGALLTYIGVKMFVELRRGGAEHAAAVHSSMTQAVFAIALGDVSLSLDNVLAVAGAARSHVVALVFGLFLSVGLMGMAVAVAVPWVQRYRWIGYVGAGVIVYVAVGMMVSGWGEVGILLAQH